MPNTHSTQENQRTLKNSDITYHIEQMMPKLVALLVSKNAVAKDAQQSSLPPEFTETINELLQTSSVDEASLTIDALNTNYARLMRENGGRHTSPLISVPGNATLEDREALAAAARLHINSIVDGFKLGQRQSTSFDRAERRRNVTVVKEVHHYHGCQDNFWRDYILYNSLFNSNLNTCNHYPQLAPSTSRSKKEEDNQVTWMGILLALGMIAGALATAGYDVMQTYYRVDEIVHGEDILGNTAKLSVTAFSAFSGYLLGAMIGASCFANPILGGVCLAFITAAAGMAAAKWVVGKIHASDNNDSASVTDPRFCLTAKEEQRLIKQGTNPEVAKEILRECAMVIENEPTNGLVFWQNPHKGIINIARKVKAGRIGDAVDMDMTHKLKDRLGKETGEKVVLTKLFDLTKPFSVNPSESVTYDPATSKTDSNAPSAPPAVLEVASTSPAHQFFASSINSSETDVSSAPPADWNSVPVATAVVVGSM